MKSSHLWKGSWPGNKWHNITLNLLKKETKLSKNKLSMKRLCKNSLKWSTLMKITDLRKYLEEIINQNKTLLWIKCQCITKENQLYRSVPSTSVLKFYPKTLIKVETVCVFSSPSAWFNYSFLSLYLHWLILSSMIRLSQRLVSGSNKDLFS